MLERVLGDIDWCRSHIAAGMILKIVVVGCMEDWSSSYSVSSQQSLVVEAAASESLDQQHVRSVETQHSMEETTRLISEDFHLWMD